MFYVVWHSNPSSSVNLEFPGDDWTQVMERIVKQLFPDPPDNRKVEEILKARKK